MRMVPWSLPKELFERWWSTVRLMAAGRTSDATKYWNGAYEYCSASYYDVTDGYHPLVLLSMVFTCFCLLYLAKECLVELYRWMRVHWKWYMMEIDFSPERMVMGSEFEKASTRPPFQAEIFVSKGEEFYMAGQGFMTEGWFITANHVIEGASQVRIKTELDTLELPRKRFEEIEGDVAFLKLSNEEASRLGLRRAKLMGHGVRSNSGLFVKCQAFQKSSMGMLENHPAFGWVSYHGSTVKGFSGAPYFVGNTVFGMHVGGLKTNIGYDAAYLRMLVLSRLEDSEEWLIKQAMKGKKFKYERNPYDPDEYRVEMDGNYYTVSSEGLARMQKRTMKGRGGKVQFVNYTGTIKPEEVRLQEDDWIQEEDKDRYGKTKVGRSFERKSKGKGFVYEARSGDSSSESISSEEESDDSVPLAPRGAFDFDDSENLMRPLAVNAGGPSKDGLEKKVRVVVTPRDVKSSEMGSSSQQPSEISTMDGHKPIPAPRREVLEFTPESSKKQEKLSRRRNRRQNLKKKIASLQQQLKAMQLGE